MEPSRERAPRRIAAALVGPAVIVLVPLFVVAWSFWPGHMSSDTVSQIESIESGDFTNQHAALLASLWYPLYHLGFGPGFVLIFQGLVFATGTWLLLRTALSRMATAAATALICFSPPVFGMLGYISRDVWYTAATLLTFGLAARAVQRPDHRALRIALVLIAAWSALAARQNAPPVIGLALLVVAALLLEGRVWGSRRRHVLAVVGVGLGLGLGLVATQTVARAVIGVSDVHPEQYTMIYDLAGISHRERVNLFPPEVMERRGMEVIDQHWNVDHVRFFIFVDNSPVIAPLAPEKFKRLREAWLDAIVDHPISYLKTRIEMQRRQLGIGRPAIFVYHPRIDENPFGFTIHHPGWNEAARDYIEGFADDYLNGRAPFYVLWLYLLLAVVAGAWLLVKARAKPALAAVGAFGLSALTWQLGLFLGAMVLQYRFEFPMVVTSIVTCVVAAFVWRSERRDRHAAPAPAA